MWEGELVTFKTENVNSSRHHKQNENRNHKVRKDFCNMCNGQWINIQITEIQKSYKLISKKKLPNAKFTKCLKEHFI